MFKFYTSFRNINLRNSNLCGRRSLRKAVGIKTTPFSIPSEDNLQTIEVTREKLDLNTTNLSASARQAIEKDPNLIKSHGGDSLLNKHGHIEVKKYKFNIEANSFFNDFVNKNKPTEVKEPFSIPSLESLDLAEDPQTSSSHIACSGCGAHLHCKSRHVAGFMLADAFKAMTKKELRFAICYRCETLNKKKILLNLESQSYDYEKFIIKRILAQRKAHVILLIDLLDIPNSIYGNWSMLIKNANASKSQ